MSDFVKNLEDVKIQVYLDSADLDVVSKYSSFQNIKGFTSNPK